MTTHSSDEVYDLLILVDATYSMVNYLEALQTSLPKVITISNLTNSFSRIGLLAYRDYSESDRSKNGLLEWSGWYNDPDNFEDAVEAPLTAQMLTSMVAGLEPIGGGDYPEATKTGLARAHQLMRKEATTLILLYTDAPPHCWMVADQDPGSNYYAEQTALCKPSSYDGFGHKFADWVSACRALYEGEKKAHVFCFLDQELGSRPLNAGYYTFLSTITRGACFTLTNPTPHNIAHVTVDVLLAWMGAGKEGVGSVSMAAKLMRYKSGKNMKNIVTEHDELANTYFWAADANVKGRNVFIAPKLLKAQRKQEQIMRLDNNLAQIVVDAEVLRKHLPKRRVPIMDFAKRYAEDPVYRNVVIEQLQNIVETDVTSMSLNPVFGVLWRKVCNDRQNPARNKLITAFGLHVERITNADERERMKNWLEESYDYATEILDTLDKVPKHQQFPCVFLDPTIDFAPISAGKSGDQDNEDDEDDRPENSFGRDELLEIGRSCDGRILRRLGKVLTRLTYVESMAELPAHIAATSNTEVPKIPTALASGEFGWSFWKILLHVVVPGTMLAARPSVVLAALAIRIGLKPLFDAAYAVMLFWRDKWNNLEVPETWNSSCLGLLLEADAEYRKQASVSEELDVNNGLLLEADRKLFTRLVAYQHMGANLSTTLTVEVGWTPQKTRVPLGPTVVCRGCRYPRSITIMTERSGGKCGLCESSWGSVEHTERAIRTSVTTEDNSSTKVAWVECSVRTCRAQYVCYNTAKLNVRPKCWYCRRQTSLLPNKRNASPAPTLECTKCLNRVIWADEWRYMLTQPFGCTACVNEMKTVIGIDTTADLICKENGQDWLLRNDNRALEEPFKHSLFKTITATGIDSFLRNVTVLPNLESAPILTLNGKRIQNLVALFARLRSFQERHIVERLHCSLCFSAFPRIRLLPACRRRGCHQNICRGCLDGWYGQNSAGTIINTAALFCPFCRRPPAARTLAVYGKGIHAVGDLKAAFEERGSWIHAWCFECAKAKRLVERECSRGAPDAVEQWRCEDCIDAAYERARLAEAAAREAMERAAQLDARRAADAQRALRLAEGIRKELECPVMECPGCKVPTQKTFGCDHMTCRCGTHWCWACGGKSSRSDIYDHIHQVHGGLYTGGNGLGLDWQD
jgi:hypothetical protein